MRIGLMIGPERGRYRTKVDRLRTDSTLAAAYVAKNLEEVISNAFLERGKDDLGHLYALV